MKIALVGKGGSGKTTLAALLARYWVERGKKVLAIDADINQHLVRVLGASPDFVIPAMGLGMDRIKDYLRGNNSLIASGAMIKTTPPGVGSRFLALSRPNPVFDYFARDVGGVRCLAVGPFEESDLGVKCFHSKTGSVEMVLNHLIDQDQDRVIIDMTAGADAFASGLFTRFDLTLIVVEPTLQSLGVYEQYAHYAAPYGVKIGVIANKLHDPSDLEFIRERVGDHLVAAIGHSNFVRKIEKGKNPPLSSCEPENMAALETVEKVAADLKKDWKRYWDEAVTFHQRNAESWANAAYGIDLSTQVDRNFDMEKAAQEMF